MKRKIFKLEVLIDDNGTIKVTSYANRQIPTGILCELNNKAHEAANKWNGDTDWMRTYVHFDHEGISYKQIDQKAKHCEGCCFYQYNKGNCLHPFFSTKPVCTGKIYIVKG